MLNEKERENIMKFYASPPKMDYDLDLKRRCLKCKDELSIFAFDEKVCKCGKTIMQPILGSDRFANLRSIILKK